MILSFFLCNDITYFYCIFHPLTDWFFCSNSLIKHFSKEEITKFIEEWKRYDTEHNGFLPEKTVSTIMFNVLNFYLSKRDKCKRQI